MGLLEWLNNEVLQIGCRGKWICSDTIWTTPVKDVN